MFGPGWPHLARLVALRFSSTLTNVRTKMSHWALAVSGAISSGVALASTLTNVNVVAWPFCACTGQRRWDRALSSALGWPSRLVGLRAAGVVVVVSAAVRRGTRIDVDQC